MTFHKLLKISLLVLVVAVIGIVLVPASANAQGKITCIGGGTSCTTCFDQCQDGVICYGTACSDGSGSSGCTPCTVTKKQPLGEQGDKVLLAQLLSKDTEVAQALKSLR